MSVVTALFASPCHGSVRRLVLVGETGFSASTAVDGNDLGVDSMPPLDGGGVVVGHKVQVTLEVEAVPRPT